MATNDAHLMKEWTKPVPSNIEIGRNCYMEPGQAFNRFVSERQPGLRLGDDVKIFTWVRFSVEKQGLIEVGDRSVLVGAEFMCSEHIRVGNDVLISYSVLIADCDFHPLDPELRIQDALANRPGDVNRTERPSMPARPVVIEDEVQVGMGSMILKGVTLGRGSVVLPGSVVTTDVPAGAIARGNPAKMVQGNGSA